MEQDRKFFDTFMVILGGLMLLSVVIIIIANNMGDQNLRTQLAENPRAQQEQAERIAPVGQACVEGKPETCEDVDAVAAPQKQASTAAGAGESADAGGEVDGESVYQNACFACHGSGAAGAPKTGDADAWESRIAKGMDTLEDHAINGFQGDAGMMPPKGGRTDLSDEEVVAALDYMVDESR